jgi:hypothetical protein
MKILTQQTCLTVGGGKAAIVNGWAHNKNMNGKTTRWASPKALTFSRYIKRYT